jgi:hypothetical protein
MRAANRADDLRFHFNRVCACGFPQPALFLDGDGDPIVAMKLYRTCARVEQGAGEAGVFVRGENDGASSEIGVEATGETTA